MIKEITCWEYQGNVYQTKEEAMREQTMDELAQLLSPALNIWDKMEPRDMAQFMIQEREKFISLLNQTFNSDKETKS